MADIQIKPDSYIGFWVMVDDDPEHIHTTHCMTYLEAVRTMDEVREEMEWENSQFGVGA